MYKKWILTIVMLVVTLSVVGVQANETNPVTVQSGLSAILPFIDSNRYTHAKTDELVVSPSIHPEYTAITTDFGTLYVDPDSLAFQVEHEGYVFSSTVDLAGEDVPQSVIYAMQSALNIQSFNTNNLNYVVVRENLYTPGTRVTINAIPNGFDATITFGTSGIKIGLIVILEEDTIRVSIPDERIIESERFLLRSIQVYKDFGAVKGDDVPGYVFIPDGVGALIDYSTDDLGTPNYKKLIYGNSLGFNTEDDLNNLTDDGYRIYAPVFGFVHGVDQHAVFANIESGGLYGNINVHYPSRNRGFTTIFSEFLYRQTYAQPVDNLGNTITLLQDNRNEVNIEISYHLLADEQANYVGMARTYRDYLLTNGLSEQTAIGVNTPLMLSFLASENKPGQLWTQHIQLATLEDILRILTDLNDRIEADLSISIDGFTRRGVSWSGPEYSSFDRRFGNEAELQDVLDQIATIYLVTNHMMAPSSGRGYSEYLDLAKKINDQIYTYRGLTTDYYLLEYDKVTDAFESSMDKLDYDGVHHAYKYFGSSLYDDFGNDKYISDLVEELQTMLATIEGPIALYDVNDYLWGYTDTFMDVPMYSSQYVSFDDTVPFLPIALSNTMDLFSPSASFLPYVRDDLLRMIDFHIYPSFIVTAKDSQELQETNLSDIYISEYDVIQPMITSYYAFVAEALNQTLNATIVSREVVSPGVVVVGYDNGLEIVINYTDQAILYASQNVAAKSYLVGDLS